MADEMREPTYLVLTALVDGPRHGYAILKEVELLSRGATILKTGTLYAILDRLERNDLIAAQSEEVVNGRLRRYYRLSELGSNVLADESRRRIAVTGEAMRRLRNAGALA